MFGWLSLVTVPEALVSGTTLVASYSLRAWAARGMAAPPPSAASAAVMTPESAAGVVSALPPLRGNLRWAPFAISMALLPLIMVQSQTLTLYIMDVSFRRLFDWVLPEPGAYATPSCTSRCRCALARFPFPRTQRCLAWRRWQVA